MSDEVVPEYNVNNIYKNDNTEENVYEKVVDENIENVEEDEAEKRLLIWRMI